MCTVTFIPRQNGYALGMNRDEKLARVEGLPPSKQFLHSRTAIFPSEPDGGTWIGVNDAGVTFALINWYSVPSRVSRHAVSRGAVTRSLLACDDLSTAEGQLRRFPLKSTNPFRILGVFPQDHAIVEWRWDLSALEHVVHKWKANIWISSGFDEPGAQRTRHRAFARALPAESNTRQWMRALHASHAPTCGPYSICMHREEAATVSYSEIEVDDVTATLAYVAGSPCQASGDWRTAELSVSRARNYRGADPAGGRWPRGLRALSGRSPGLSA